MKDPFNPDLYDEEARHRAFQKLNKAQTFARNLREIIEFGIGIIQMVSRGVRRVINFAITKIWNRIRFLVMKKRVDGTRFFSPRRTVMSILVLTFIYLLGWPTLLFSLTYRHQELMYLTKPQEIMPEHNVHAFQGCLVKNPCTEEHGIYFRVRGTLFNYLYYFVTHGRIFYPDLVAAAVPVGSHACYVNSYGIRMKFFIGQLEIYPDGLGVSCDLEEDNG